MSNPIEAQLQAADSPIIAPAAVPGGKLQAALDWAAKSFRVFPLQKNSKLPMNIAWTLHATTDPTVIRGWWDAQPEANIGCLTTDWVVVDIDVKAGKPGLQTFMAVGLEFDSLTVRTPSGGWHVYYQSFDRLVGCSPLGEGLDVRSHHGFVVAPGSTIDGVPYAVEIDFPVAQFPEQLRSRLKSPRQRADPTISDVELDDPENIAMTRHWLAHDAPVAVEGVNGDDTTYRVACLTRDLGISDSAALELMLEHWNERCEPPWSLDELRVKVENAYRYATGAAGAASPAAHFGDVVFIPPLYAVTLTPAAATPAPVTRIKATAFSWTDPAAFPRRQWLFGSHLIRKFVSCTVAPGGVGKSSLVLSEAVAMATGRNLTGTACRKGPLRVWVCNLEDPREEIVRRVLAICMHFRVNPAELDGRLFLDSGREVSLVMVTANRNGVEVAVPVVEALKDEIRAREIDVLVVDPFVKSHSVPENDNTAIDKVITTFADVADATGCAIELVHHVRKTGGAEITVEDGRGAVALLAGVRSARVLNPMTREEAEQAGGLATREYFRATNGKANLAPSPDKSDWFRLHSVSLGNGDPADVFDPGDQVGVVAPWNWPDPAVDATDAQRSRVQGIVAEGEWRADVQCGEKWIGAAVASVLGYSWQDKTKRKLITKTIEAWLADDVIRKTTRKTENRKTSNFIEVGAWPMRSAPPLQGGALQGSAVAQNHCATTPLI